MKKIGIVSSISLLSMFLIFFFSTYNVKGTSLYYDNYYQKTTARIDSVKSEMVIGTNSLKAGFAKVSITPAITIPGEALPNIGFFVDQSLLSGLTNDSFW